MPSTPSADVRCVRRFASAIAVARLGALHLLLGLAKRVVPVATLAAWASRRRRPRLASRDLVISRVLRAGAIVGSPDRDCLQRSLLLYRELCRIGAPATLVVGVRKVDHTLAGHAWVRLDGEVVAESDFDVDRFMPLLTFDAPSQLHA